MTKKKARNPWVEKNQGQLYVALNSNNDEWVTGTLQEVRERVNEWLEDCTFDVHDLGVYALGTQVKVEVDTIRKADFIIKA